MPIILTVHNDFKLKPSSILTMMSVKLQVPDSHQRSQPLNYAEVSKDTDSKHSANFKVLRFSLNDPRKKRLKLFSPFSFSFLLHNSDICSIRYFTNNYFEFDINQRSDFSVNAKTFSNIDQMLDTLADEVE